jgi:lysophospholipase L1-like esterase
LDVATPSLGTRYDQTYPSGTTAGNNLTKSGSGTTTYAANTLTWAVANSGTPLTNEHLTQNNYSTSLERWTRTITFKLNALNSHTVGIGIGTAPIIASTIQNQFTVAINSGTGVVTFNAYYGTSAFTSVGSQLTSMAIAANDVCNFTVSRNVNVTTLILENVTQGKTVAWNPDLSIALGPAAAHQCIMYNLGGSYDVTQDLLFSNETKSPRYIFVGDSKSAGTQANKDIRFPTILFKGTDQTYVVYAVSHNYIRGFDSYCIAEINEIAQGQATIILLGGSNDKALGGDSDATIRTNLNALVTALTTGAGSGNTIWVCRDTPRDGYTMSGIAANIATDYPSNNIDLYNPFLISGGTMAYSEDGVHPSTAGHKMIADILTKELGLTDLKQRDLSTDFPWGQVAAETQLYSYNLFKSLGLTTTGFTSGSNLIYSDTKSSVVNSNFNIGGTGGTHNVNAFSQATFGGYYAQNTLNTGFTRVMIENNRGSAASFLAHAYVGSTSTAFNTVFGISSAVDWAFTYAGGASNAGYAIGTTAATPLLFATNNVERIRVLSGGNVGVSVTAPTSILHTTSFATGYVAKTGAYGIGAADHTIEVTSGTHSQTLPTAVGITGRIYTITNSGSGTVTVATTSSQTFVNVTATPTTLSLAQFKFVTVQSNGSNWLVISQN